METKHTDLPWELYDTAGHAAHGQTAIYSKANGKDIAIIYEGDINAEFIVRACNSYEDMLEACRRHKKQIIENYGNAVWDANWDHMEAAIAKAEGD